MCILKKASISANYKLSDLYYDSARLGMLDLLQTLKKEKKLETILIPAYIGHSPKEGSGIFDPIKKAENIDIHFYKIDKNLNVNLESFFAELKKIKTKNAAVLIVNYFGFTDPNIQKISFATKQSNAWLIEDNAHGFFTNLYFENELADATFFSLHKMFPFSNGGLLRLFNDEIKKMKFKGRYNTPESRNPWDFDLFSIAKKRKSNYKELEKLINFKKNQQYFEPIKSCFEEHIVPQTLPIIIKVGNRDKIYDLMNKSGYGVISLYHTLIEPLRKKEYCESIELSRKILNLPVHQDVDPTLYPKMISKLLEFCLLTK